jgi:hypothetical protein
VFSEVVLLKSSKYRQQAWHLDSPHPNVFVNLLYLTAGQMTQFMVPASLAADVLEMKAPVDDLFAPLGILDESSKCEPDDTSADPVISERWRDYMKKR